jgi:D-sedoheptulose 7-phosphate isomerase
MNKENTFSQGFLAEAKEVIDRLDATRIEAAASLLASTRAAGRRLFVLGVGGSAANASHAVNDFRKIAGIEAYAPTDNVSELTARVNDEGWPTVFEAWLRTSRLRANDLVLVLSVGGGDLEKNVSPNLVAALQFAKSVDAKILGIVGRDGGYTAKVADVCVVIPTVNPAHITPHTEAFQAVVWHLLVSHPAVKQQPTKWESTVGNGRPAVFLDRDGVLNRAVVRNGKPLPPGSLAEFEIIPGTASALRDLKAHGFALYVVTNQPDVSRGTQTREAIEAMHRALSSALPIDDIFVCYHDDKDACDCRKPKPGLLFQAQRKHGIDLARSFFIGDRWRDIDAGDASGCKTVLIDYGYGEKEPAHPPDATVKSLPEAADWIIASTLKGTTDEVHV